MRVKNWISNMFLVLFLVIPAVALAAGDPDTPTILNGAKIVSAEEVKKIVDQKAATIVDTRNPLNYGKGHIPGAILIEYKGKSENVPNFDDSIDQFDSTKLPSDRGAKIVFYGHGTTGWKGYKAAVKAVKAGYKNVLWFRGGLEEWDKKGYPKE